VPDQSEIIRAYGRALCAIYSNVTGQPAPDALRARLGRETALLVLEAAGMAAGVEARWAADAAPVQQQRQQSQLFADDPMHDPRVVQAQVRGGDVKAALREVAEDTSNPLRAQRAAIALDILAAGRVKYSDTQIQAVGSPAEAVEHARVLIAMRRYERQGSQPVPLGVSAGEDGRPIQRSAVHRDAGSLGRS
jgi:hypothetical protein